MATRLETAKTTAIAPGEYTTPTGGKYLLSTTTLLSGEAPLSVMMMTPSFVKKPVGIIQFVHGMCEYKERYRAVMEYFVDLGYSCIIHDHRGHGQSVTAEEDYGYIGSGDQNYLVDDTYSITLYAKARIGSDLPFFMVGHSMGSLIARIYLKDHDEELTGLILSGPPYQVGAAGFGVKLARAMEKTRGARYISNLLTSMSTGAYDKAFPEEPPASWVVRDPDVYKAYIDDPLCGFPFTANGYRHLFMLVADTFSIKGWNLKKPGLPILVLAGEDDPCAGNRAQFRGTVLFLKHIGYPMIRWKRYAGMRHEIMNETSKYAVYADMSAFVLTHTKKYSSKEV